MKIGPLLSHLQKLEAELAETYRSFGERHTAEHDVHHQCQSFAKQAEQHAEGLAPHTARYGQDMDAGQSGFGQGPFASARRTDSESRPDSGLLLLADLRTLLLAVEEVSITWVMAGQAAQAARD